MQLPVADVDVVVSNFKTRTTGVTSTIAQIVPVQAQHLRIAAIGWGLPKYLPRLSWRDFWRLLQKPRHQRFRIWHARRNNEMLLGILLRDVFRAPVRLVFSSAAQRNHKSLTQWMLRRMDWVIAIGERPGSFLCVPHDVVRHGIDLDRFHPPQAQSDGSLAASPLGVRAVGCFGRIRAQKGTDLFVQSMIELLPDYPGWSAVICGRTTLRHGWFLRGLKSRIAAAGLTDRIVFLGEVPDIAPWHRRVDLYVAPARVEGFGLTPLEAMASGKAVVASDAGAHADMIEDGVTGAVVPAGDGAALTEAIRSYMSDDERTRSHGEKALARVRCHFRLSDEAKSIAGVYERLWANDR